MAVQEAQNSTNTFTPSEAGRNSALAAAVVYETLVEALLNVPDERVCADVIHVANLLGVSSFESSRATASNAELEQRYYDRFFTPTSPYYVPLCESCVRGSGIEDGARRYKPTVSAAADHVAACYRTAGFEFSSLAGYSLAVQTLRADSLASELAFLGFLAHSEALASTAGEALHIRRLQVEFLRDHLSRWIAVAAKALAETEDDFYAQIVAVASAWVELEKARVAD